MQDKRKLDIVILSDLHLGTYGCHAKEILTYLKSVNTKKLILNGDIFDIWNYSKSYFPNSHLKVIRYILKMAGKGTEVIYLTGNHDDMLRNFTPMYLGNIQLLDSYVLQIDDKKAWVFHGDVFDNTTKGMAKFIAVIGGKGYDLLIVLNRIVNWFLHKLGCKKASFSKRIKNGVKKAVTWINDFEEKICEIAAKQEYDYVICGHIHKQEIKYVETKHGSVIYMNSGDWVENLTALECIAGQFSIYQYKQEDYLYPNEADEIEFELSNTTSFIEQTLMQAL